MSITKAFFVRELIRLRRNIARLEGSLTRYPPQSERADGQRALLAIEQRNRIILFDLAEHAADPVALDLALRLRYGKARQRHDRAARASAVDDHHLGDDWWESLGEIQYLAFLQARLKELLQQHGPESIKREIEAAARYKDLGPGLALKEVLHALASSHRAEQGMLSILQDDIGMPED